MLRRRHLLQSAPALLATPSLAQTVRPAGTDRPLRIVVPFTAGGNTDVIARLMAEPMAARLGRAVLVDNRPGGGGAIGAEMVARAAADGTTALLGSGGTLTANPVLQARLAYDAEKDFRPLALIATMPLVLVVGPRLRVENWAGMLAQAKAQPGAISMASPGTGSIGHLALELLNHQTGAGLTHVPYRGGGALVPDLLAGNVDCSLLELTTALPLHQAGQARILVVAAPARAPLLPDVPSFAEAGVPGFSALSYGGLLVPAATPDAMAEALRAALLGAMADPAVGAKLAALGAELAGPAERTPEGFAAFLRGELAKARQAAALAGLKPE